jgi:hypothetical protein
MNDNAGDAVVLDSSANTYHGTLYDAYDAAKATWSTGKTKNHDATGRIDGALSFDGVDDMVNLPVFDINSNKMTFTAWVKRDGENEIYAGFIACFGTNDFNAAFCLGLGSEGTGTDWLANNEVSYFWNGFYWDWHSELIVPDGIWTLVALTVAPDKAVAYLHDGVNLQAATNYAPHAKGQFDFYSRIGHQMQFGPEERFFKGDIDEVRIYQRTLSPGEILSLALLGAAGTDYLEMDPWRAYSDGDDDVDIFDYIPLADNWLKDVKWP